MKQILLLLLLLKLISCKEYLTQNESNPLIDSAATVQCIRVLDGDTWAFEIKNEEFKVRCLGFDAFETRRGDRLKEQADAAGISEDSALSLGLRQKAYADSVLRGREVTIVRDYSVANMDVYGRLLRNCYIKSLLFRLNE